MSTFNEIEMTTPYGDTDNVLELNIDSRSDAYVLKDVIKLSSTYTFSIWYRTEIDSQITFNVLGESETVDSTTTWNKFVKTVTAETLDETNIYIMPSVGVNSYLYEGYLSEGITDTSWLPAPEDIEGEIGSVRSELVQTADSILARVSASDGRISTLETNLEGITGRVEDAEGNITQLQQTSEEISLKVGNAEKIAIESKVLAVNLSIETMTVATDTDGNNGSYSNCKTTVNISYGVDDVTSSSIITCTPADGVTGSWDSTKYTYTISNMTVDTGTVDISATYTTTIDDVEQNLSATRTFSVTKSKQGVAGNKGEQGIPGKDGTSSHTHIAYANSADGQTDFSVSDSDREYIGMYVDDQVLDSTDPTDYKWTLVKGIDGKNGIPGTPGEDGKTPYFHTAYANSADGQTDFSITDSDREYIGQYTDYIDEDSTDPTDYAWSKIKGDDGISVASVTPEYYLSTSDTEVIGGEWSETPPVQTDDTYIWKREHTIYEDGTESYSSPALDQSLNELFRVTAELKVGQEEISAEISDAKGSSTTLKARLEGIESTVTNADNDLQTQITQNADNINLVATQKENVPVTAVRYIRDWLNGCSVNEKNVLDLRKYLAEDQTSKNMTITQLAYNSISIHCENVSSYTFFSIDLSETVKVGKKYTIYFDAIGTNTNISIDEATDAEFSDRTIINASSVTIKDGYYYRLKIYGNKTDTDQTTTYDNVYTNVKLIETTNVAIVETQVTNVDVCYYNPVSIDRYDTADYADEMIVENGEITLVNPTTITISSTENCKLLIGKYVYLSNKKAYYRVPSDATVTYKTGVTSKTWRLSTAYKLSPEELYNNRWVECMVVSGDINLAVGISPTCKDADLNTIETSNLDYYTDEMILDEDIRRYVDSGVESCLELDLGSVYYDIDYIQIWHYYDDNRVYNHKLQTSTDGVTWVTLYDSSVTGGYEESVDGKLYYLNESNIISSMNKLSMTLNETRSQLSDTSGNLSTLTQTVEGINETVSKNYEDANSALVKLREDLDAKISETEKALANFRIEAGNIYATAESVDKNNNKLASLIQQSSSGWEALFAELNMGENKDKYNIQTNITLNKNGITVTNPTTGQTTQMTIDQFCGLYHGEKVFWIDKDTTKTRRLLCEKGWDTDYIKMTTNAYKYANGTVVKGVSFVKSGGTS